MDEITSSTHSGPFIQRNEDPADGQEEQDAQDYGDQDDWCDQHDVDTC